MGFANWVPIGFSGYNASDSRRVVPVPGLTGIAITSHRAYNFVKLIFSAYRLMVGASMGR
jgi:hypothetical protein